MTPPVARPAAPSPVDVARLDPNVIPAEWTAAAMEGLARRRFGPLAGVLNDAAIIELANDAGAALAGIWPLVTAVAESLFADHRAVERVRALCDAAERGWADLTRVDLSHTGSPAVMVDRIRAALDGAE